MKMTEYTQIYEVTEDSIILTDGDTNGTRKILMTDAVLSALGLVGWQNRRRILRGKNLGDTFTVAQKAAVQGGTFDDLYLGDYWEVSGVKYRIVDFDYWYGYGDTAFTSHHLVIMPDTALYTAAMNASSTTAGGYTGSQMYTTNLENAKTTINGIFGSSVLTHREYLINTVANGYPSAGAYADSSIELPNEPMIFGSYIYTPGNTGTTDVKRYTNSNRQLALFAVDPSKVICSGGFWLRDVVSATHFARVDSYGGSTSTGGANAYGVRPVFPIG